LSSPDDAHALDAAPVADVRAIVLVYAGAIVLGVIVAWLTPAAMPLRLLAGTSVATVAVWLVSARTNNASTYDAYWSVAPATMAVGLGAAAWSGDAGGDPLRGALAVLLTLAWAWRLTANWLRGWGGFGHEDWRYVRIREQTGVFWQPVNFLGVHLMPTLMTWAGSLPLVPVLLADGASLGPLDALGAALATLGIWLEWRADEDLHAFRRRRRDASELLDEGIWGRCRHPNYLGEMLFWWGLGVLALASSPDRWPWLAGAGAITALFLGVSIRLIETRLGERKPAYAAYRARVPMLLPFGRPARPGP
jgi:steroid 5-alpha reductase family enzyme